MTRSQQAAKWLAALFLLAVLLVGLCTYQQYGITYDEAVERQSSIINYQYILKTLLHHDLQVVDQELATWKDRYYGVAFQLPMVLVEHLYNFTLPVHDVFVMRHLCTFLICFGGWVCLYVFLQKVFQNRWLSLLGLMMTVLYPRFFGEQFTNIKDMVFTAACCASLMMVALCLEKHRWWMEALAALAFALCTNTRVIGLMIPLLLAGYRVLCALLDRKNALREMARFLAQLALVLVFWVMVTPAAWQQPFQFLPNVFSTFSHYDPWDASLPFLGQMVRGQALPWYYIPVWLLLSLPIWYLAALAAGLWFEGKTLLGMLRRGQGRQWLASEHRYGMLCFVIAVAPFAVVLVKSVTLYNAWRHVYYIFPCLVVLMVFGVRALYQKLLSRAGWRKGLCAAMAALLLYQTGWIIREYPLEKVYFNPVGKAMADGMDRDYWYEGMWRQFRYILDHDSAETVVVSCYNHAGDTYLNYLTDQERERVRMISVGHPDTEYLIDTAVGIGSETFEGFVPVHRQKVDGVVISTIYASQRMIDERFGGDYPEDDDLS